jgi:hypothetical protein
MSSPSLLIGDVDPGNWEDVDQAFAAVQTWAGKQDSVIETRGYATHGQPRCVYTKTATQAITTATETYITWPTIFHEDSTNPEQYDNGANWEAGTFLSVADGSQFRAPIPGLYLALARVTFAANATGERSLAIEWQRIADAALPSELDVARSVVNSASYPTILKASTLVTIDDPASLSIAFRQWVRLNVYQDSGGNLDVTGANFQMIKLS